MGIGTACVSTTDSNFINWAESNKYLQMIKLWNTTQVSVLLYNSVGMSVFVCVNIINTYLSYIPQVCKVIPLQSGTYTVYTALCYSPISNRWH